MITTGVGKFMQDLMAGKLSDEVIIEFLTELRARGETVDEIVEAAKVMREHAIKVEPEATELLDTCGTGGDGHSTFNVSTLTALLCSAAGIHVAKHGNKSISSQSGSADFLKALGLDLELSPEQIAKGIDRVGFGFMFAPLHHPSMKHAASARAKMKTRTLFNCLGPLTNPAGAKFQLLGVYDKALAEPLAMSLGALGSEHVLVVHGENGEDEVSITGKTFICEWVNEHVKSYIIEPRDLGFKTATLHELKVDSPTASLEVAMRIVDGEKSPHRDLLIMNAAHALYAANRVKTPVEGRDLAVSLIDEGKLKVKLNAIKTFYSEIE